MTTATKAIAGIGGLLTTTAVPSIYLTVSSSSGNGKETATVDTRPTGRQWLLGSGYIPNKPTFKSQDSLKHGCSENLFSNNKEESDPTKDEKLYGCAVMKMDLGNTGVIWSNKKDPKWIKFNSEVAVRKRDEGWVINSRVDNWSNDGSISFDYILTTYKYKNEKWGQEGNPKLWKDPVAWTATSYPNNQFNSEGHLVNNVNIYQPKTRPVIKVPGEYWFSNDDWIHPDYNSKTKTKILKETKSWSGVWIDGEGKGNSWVFGDINLYVGEKKYSQVFCKEDNSCRQEYTDGNYLKTTNSAGGDTWTNASKGTQNDREKAQDMVTTTVKGIIDKLKNSKGTWMKLEDICDAKIDEAPSKEHQQQLRMYCSNGKKN